MAMAQSPRMAHDGSRSRYAAAFTSTIFAPCDERGSARFVPQGKRRDQTTSELFGSYEEKDLRGMPKTFIPKDDNLTAREKKLQFLSSEVLPCTSHRPHPPAYTTTENCFDVALDQEASSVKGYGYADEEEIATSRRRQMELSSKLFGRQTPQVSNEHASARLTPNDFTWHSHPEPVHSPGKVEGMSYMDRAYREKCSKIFDHESPGTQGDFFEEKRQARQDDCEASLRRRANAQYSDLFGRSASSPGPCPEPPGAGAGEDHARWAKHVGSHEHRIGVHQDWTDSKTELLAGARALRYDQPNHMRKSDELHQTRIFGGQDNDWQPSARVEAVTHDNSQKLKSAIGLAPQHIHQAHLRSSMTPDDFYQQAESTKDWEVVELHVSGLARDADDRLVKDLCQGCDLHIVKASVEMDPVRNLCMGRAKIMVRYNPTRDSIAGLVQKLERTRLKGEL
jgi:hypothetical protein